MAPAGGRDGRRRPSLALFSGGSRKMRRPPRRNAGGKGNGAGGPRLLLPGGGLGVPGLTPARTPPGPLHPCSVLCPDLLTHAGSGGQPGGGKSAWGLTWRGSECQRGDPSQPPPLSRGPRRQNEQCGEAGGGEEEEDEGGDAGQGDYKSHEAGRCGGARGKHRAGGAVPAPPRAPPAPLRPAPRRARRAAPACTEDARVLLRQEGAGGQVPAALPRLAQPRPRPGPGAQRQAGGTATGGAPPLRPGSARG